MGHRSWVNGRRSLFEAFTGAPVLWGDEHTAPHAPSRSLRRLLFGGVGGSVVAARQGPALGDHPAVEIGLAVEQTDRQQSALAVTIDAEAIDLAIADVRR